MAAAAALVALTLALAWRYLAVAHLVPEEEHYRVGAHLYATGILSIDETPSVFRPPGFPAFVALVLHLRDALQPGTESMRAVALAHGILLSLGALALFLHTSRTQPLRVALAAGLLYALNPLQLSIARYISYYALHMALVSLGVLALSRALESGPRRSSWALAAGLLWGLATLVRPLSLLLPPFVLLLARWQDGRGAWRNSLRLACLFTLGMGLVVSPYTLRNHQLTQRWILVNAQDGYALWGLSATRHPLGDLVEWSRLWSEEGQPVFVRVAGAPYRIELLYEHQLTLNDAFRAEAFVNIRKRPGRFLANVLANVVGFNFDSAQAWLDHLAHVREGRGALPRLALARPLGTAVLLLGVVGIVWGLRRREPDARVLFVVYAMFLVAHSLVILMSRYTYVRLPLLFLGLPLAFRELEGHPRARCALLATLALTLGLAWEISLR